MKARIEHTAEIVTVDGQHCRVWNGITEGGVPFTAYIARLRVVEGQEAEFERELRATPAPAIVSTQPRAIDMRMLL